MIECPLHVHRVTIFGFGGATAVVSRATLSAAGQRPPEMTVSWHEKTTRAYRDLLEQVGEFCRTNLARDPETVLDQLWQRLSDAQSSPAMALCTGLDDVETRKLMTTRDTRTATRLVRAGLAKTCALQQLRA